MEVKFTLQMIRGIHGLQENQNDYGLVLRVIIREQTLWHVFHKVESTLPMIQGLLGLQGKQTESGLVSRVIPQGQI
jgi:hypothetical protein